MKSYKENTGSVEKGNGQRILIVDDDAASLGVISDFLGDSGFVVLVARNGERGIERARYARPDIIFLDILMPGIDGFETCRRLKSDPITANIPVIFMTSLTDTEDKVKGFEAGAVDYVTKPFQSREVLSRTRMQLRLSALTQDLQHTNEELTKHRDHLEELVEERTAEIRAQSKFLQTAIDALPHPFYTVNIEDYSISHFNKATGINISEKISTCYGLVHGRSEPCGKDEHSCPIEEIKATGRPAMVEHIHLAKNGNERISEIHAFPIFDKEGNLSEIIEYTIDITERKLAEQALKKAHDGLELQVAERTRELKVANDQLVHSEKLSAMGRLSASIAHEINNPLCGVLNVLERVQGRAIFEKKDKELVDLALKECHRMKDLIKNLQQFNKPTSGIRVELDIHQLIDEVLILMKKEFKNKKITVEKEYAANLPHIWIVSDQLKQVILNILSNARDAIETEEGTITLSSTLLDKNRISITVKDSGEGISSEMKKKIFEPFHTTKAIKGMGLGLSVSYGIIKSHGGNISVKSEAGQGATFTITLPIGKRKCH